VYYLSYPHPSFKNWWVVYKVHPKMHTRRYDEYVEGHHDDEIYQKEIEHYKTPPIATHTYHHIVVCVVNYQVGQVS
jgi:hypothetical protein